MGKSQKPGSRALSARRAPWQLSAALACAALLAANPARAVPGGDLGTLETGRYVCELPGDASGAAGNRLDDAGFRIVSASSYAAEGRIGSYLLTGDMLVMTSGPRKGERYHRISRGFLRLVGSDGKDTTLRCVRATRNNS